MSLTIRHNRKDERVLTFAEWVDELDHPDVLLESHGILIHVQADDSICVISWLDEIVFTIYDNVGKMRDDLELDDDDKLIVLSAIDIAYSKQME